ncbi:MAG TPA: NmrA family NAD(P)-binding protein, partial [Candidatus Limnocylindria bacterium]|nr:NmrA family NAD(P)-binding protein [Candidatus Limnocylindria bacterium]
MILVCGATGLLGSRIVDRLRERDVPVRALVRPRTDATALEAVGAEIARGDVRDTASLRAAVQGVSSVVSTVNTVARVMAGEKGLSIREVDDRGHA